MPVSQQWMPYGAIPVKESATRQPLELSSDSHSDTDVTIPPRFQRDDHALLTRLNLRLLTPVTVISPIVELR